MEIEDLSERVTDRLHDTVGGLRDRTADAVRGDGGSVFREFTKLGRRVDANADALHTRLDDVESSLGARIDELIAGDRATTWPRRLFWLAVGAGVGVVAAYLGDPDRGKARRAQLADQASARSRDMADQAAAQAKMTADRTKGQLIEQAKDALPERPEEDAHLLEQRIKSEVFGRRQDTAQVVLRVDGPGAVALKGTVPTAVSERELLSQVAEVDGVIDVTSELSVRST